MRTRIKICAMTRVADALLAAELGVDAIGLIFYAPSSRFVSIAQALQIINALPAFVTAVGVFVNASPEYIHPILAQVPLGLLQFHGQETAEECRSYGRPYIKAVSMQPAVNLKQIAETYSDAKALLLDTHKTAQPGGTGETFDWALVPKNFSMPLILAGGLTPENVACAIAQVRPYAVDVVSGVEVEKGLKSAEKMRRFVQAVALS